MESRLGKRHFRRYLLLDQRFSPAARRRKQGAAGPRAASALVTSDADEHSGIGGNPSALGASRPWARVRRPRLNGAWRARCGAINSRLSAWLPGRHLAPRAEAWQRELCGLRQGPPQPAASESYSHPWHLIWRGPPLARPHDGPESHVRAQLSFVVATPLLDMVRHQAADLDNFLDEYGFFCLTQRQLTYQEASRAVHASRSGRSDVAPEKRMRRCVATEGSMI